MEGTGGWESGSNGGGVSLQEAGEERAREGIPKGAGIEKNMKYINFCNIAQFFALEKALRGGQH